MSRGEEKLSEYPEASHDPIPEGLRLVLVNGWIYVLPSSDFPQLDFTLEANNANVEMELEQYVNQQVKRLIS